MQSTEANAQRAAYIEKALAEAPPLSDEQRRKIGYLISSTS